MFGLIRKAAQVSKPHKRSGIPDEYRYDRAYCEQYFATNRKAIKERTEFEKARAECNAYAARVRAGQPVKKTPTNKTKRGSKK